MGILIIVPTNTIIDWMIFAQNVEWFVMLQMIRVQKHKDYKQIVYEQQNPAQSHYIKKTGINYGCLLGNERRCKRFSMVVATLLMLVNILLFAGNLTDNKLIGELIISGIKLVNLSLGVVLALTLQCQMYFFHRFEFDQTRKEMRGQVLSMLAIFIYYACNVVLLVPMVEEAKQTEERLISQCPDEELAI